MIYDGIKQANYSLVFAGIFIFLVILFIYFYNKIIDNKTVRDFTTEHNIPESSGKVDIKFPRRFDYPVIYYKVAVLLFAIVVFSVSLIVLGVKWPDIYDQIFKYREILSVFMVAAIFGFLGMMYFRNQTGYISYDEHIFEVKNRFFLGKSFHSKWEDLEEIVLQRMQGDNINFIIEFKKKPLIALTDDSKVYKLFVAELVEYLETIGLKDKIRGEYYDMDIYADPSSKDLLPMIKDDILNWLKSG